MNPSFATVIICHATSDFGYGHLHRMASLASEIDGQVGLVVSGSFNQAQMPVLSQNTHLHKWSGKQSDLDALISDIVPKSIVVDCLEILTTADLKSLKKIAPLILVDYRNHDGWTQAEAVIAGYLDGLESSIQLEQDTWILRGSAFILADRPATVSLSDKKGIIVCFGGSDPNQSGPKLMQYLADFSISSPLTIVSPHLKDKNRGLLKTISHTPSLQTEFSTAEIALVAGGNVLFEAILNGAVPVIWPQVDHQWITAGHFEAAGCALLPQNPVSPENAWSLVQKLCDDSALRLSLRNQGQEILDGKGASRIAGLIQGLGKGTMMESISQLKAELRV